MNPAISDALGVAFFDPCDLRSEVYAGIFALAGTLTLRGHPVPATWRYRPSPIMTEEAERADSDSTGPLLDLLDAGTITPDDMRDAGAEIWGMLPPDDN